MLGLHCCAQALSVVASGGYCLVVLCNHCRGFCCCRARARGVWASVVVAHGLAALWHAVPNQGSNPCPLRWQVDS